MSESGPDWLREVEDAIRRLPGVLGIHIEMQGDRIGTVFVRTDGSRESQRFVRDVEAVLATTAHIKIDFRKISVAATPPEGSCGPQATAPARRIAYEGVRLQTSPLETEAQVELSLGASRVIGTQKGPATRGNALELVAGACLKAASQLVLDPISFSLGGLEKVRVGRDWVLVVLVRMIRARGEVTLTGSCPCEPDDLRAAAEAALDAIGPTIRTLPLREPTEYILRTEAK